MLLALTHYITLFIAQVGYPGLTFLMILESMVVPVPSEAVMPFAGFLIFSGQFSWLGVFFWSTVGSIIGSLLSYYLGAYGGRPAIEKFGKYLLLNTHHLELTEHFFKNHGRKTVFLSRFIPIVRHLISIPAGIAKMPIWEFLLLTTIGAGLWNAVLTYLGFVLREHWDTIGHYMKIGDVIVIIAAIALIAYWIFKWLKIKNPKL